MLYKKDVLAIIVGLVMFFVIILLILIYRYTFDKNKQIGYYVVTKYSNSRDAAKILHNLNVFSITLLDKMKHKYKNNSISMEIINNLTNKYNPDHFEENDPVYTIGHKTFTLNFQRIAICLRKKNGQFYDLNTLQFVMMHELSHIATLEKEHNDYFWLIFKYILTCAQNLMGYNPVDYSHSPINYCGINVSYNPYYAHYDIDKYLLTY